MAELTAHWGSNGVETKYWTWLYNDACRFSMAHIVFNFTLDSQLLQHF